MRRWILPALILLIVPVIARAADFYQVPNGSTVTIDEHGVCRKVTNNMADGLATFVATRTANEWSVGSDAFLNALPAGVSVAACSGCTVTPGSQSFATAGSHSFVVPCHNSITVQVWGGGGGAGGSMGGIPANAPLSGSNSNFNGTVIGGGGGAASLTDPYYGSGGGASGGDTNTAGSPGTIPSADSGNYSGGKGGNAGGPGGAGGAGAAHSSLLGPNGAAPGGGGGSGGYYFYYADGWATVEFHSNSYGGGGGGYAAKTYATGALTPGASIPVVVGAGGAGGAEEAESYGGAGYDFDYYSLTRKGGNGAVGRVTITWN